MDIRKCLEILELESGASEDEARQAYKDVVNVWHPDRFANNPRLKRKAEEKLKEVNVAYETVKSFLSGKHKMEPEQKTAPKAQAETETRTKAWTEAEYYKAQAEPQARDRTQVAVETGTRMISDVCSFLFKTLRRIVVSQASSPEPQDRVESRGLNQRGWQSRGQCAGKGRGRGMSRGRGMGQGRSGGGGGMGRGRR